MRITKAAVALAVLLGGLAPLEAQLQSSSPPEQAWMQGDTLPDAAEEGDTLSYGGQVPMASGDFNGDTIEDLAIGVPHESIHFGGNYNSSVGAVHVVYGRTWGLDPTTAQTLRQGTGGLGDIGEAGEHFGFALASGDFDADGVDDLAIGVLDQDAGGAQSAGAVHIVYGEKGPGLGTRDHVLYQGLFPNSDQAENGDWFGSALAVGDFDGNGADDLAVSAPWDSVSGVDSAGLVVVFRAIAGWGLESPLCQVLMQYQIPGGATEADDRFGWALAAGDFDADGKDDLAIGTPYEGVGTVEDGGIVSVVYGYILGLDLTRYQNFNQQTLNEVIEVGDQLGFSLASGDFNGIGGDDLAVGAPGENLNGEKDGGIIHTLYGEASTGLDPGGWLSQDTYLMADSIESGDEFGHALAAGDFDGDGNDDLAIGVPGEDFYGAYPGCGRADKSGAVSVVHGSLFGLYTVGNQYWTQCAANVDSSPEPGDKFGHVLTAGDFDGNGAADLTIGVPYEDGNPSQTDCGYAHTLYGVPR